VAGSIRTAATVPLPYPAITSVFPDGEGCRCTIPKPADEFVTLVPASVSARDCPVGEAATANADTPSSGAEFTVYWNGGCVKAGYAKQ
jgi:hypothetical protein